MFCANTLKEKNAHFKFNELYLTMNVLNLGDNVAFYYYYYYFYGVMIMMDTFVEKKVIIIANYIKTNVSLKHVLHNCDFNTRITLNQDFFP